MKQMIKFTEVNVDGCGTDVEILYSIETDTLLTRGHLLRLEDAISSIKKELEDSDAVWDTDSMTDEAMRKVFGEDAVWESVYPDIEVNF